MIIRGRYGLRMVIEQAGAEGTDDIIIPFKGLMHGRRLMHSAGDRLEIMNAECVGVATPVPSYRVKWMMTVMNAIDPAFLFCLYEEIPLFIVGDQFLRRPDIPFTIG